MPTILKPINTKLLKELEDKFRPAPKVVKEYEENGVKVRVFEPR